MTGPDITLPIEEPLPGRSVRGLVPRSIFVWALLLLVVVLVGFFLADVARQAGNSREDKSPAVAEAASAPMANIVAAAPSERDIADLVERARRAGAASAPDSVWRGDHGDRGRVSEGGQGEGSTGLKDPGPLQKPTMRDPGDGVLREGSDKAPFKSGRPVADAGDRNSAGGMSTAEAQQIAERNGAGIAALEDVSNEERAPGPDVSGKLARLKSGAGIDIVPQGESEAAAFAREMTRAQERSQQDVLAAINANGGQKSGNKDQQWLKQYAAESSAEGDTRSRVSQLPVRGLVLQGTRIPVVGLEAVSSDMPGQVTARSTSDIYDSLNQSRVAIPRHTRFIGAYSSEIRPGQTRILFAFRRMVLPDGRSVDLTGAQGVDNIGRAGVEGDVDNHFLKMFGHSFVIAWISSRVSNKSGLSTSTTANGQTSTGSVAGEVLSQVAQQILQRNAQIPPTISLPPGAPFFVTLSKDVVLAPAGANNAQ